jgi:mannitol-1-phosphate 5-dehydrogenase
VHEVGDGGTDTVVTGFRAIDSSADAQAVIDEVSTADVVTTAVGPTILRFVAPHIIAGLALRDPSAPPLQIMACENGINATDLLRDEMRQQPGEGVDVTVEPFYEWAIERHPFGDSPPHIPGAHFVDDVAPYIERKLFTVDTGHATTAYYGAQAGIEKISDALAEPAIAAKVSATLEETSALLEAVHGLDATELADYRATILRKLSRNERFVSPASSAAERGLPTTALVAEMGAALEFDVPEVEQSVEMQRRLRDGEAAAFTASVTGSRRCAPTTSAPCPSRP